VSPGSGEEEGEQSGSGEEDEEDEEGEEDDEDDEFFDDDDDMSDMRSEDFEAQAEAAWRSLQFPEPFGGIEATSDARSSQSSQRSPRGGSSESFQDFFQAAPAPDSAGPSDPLTAHKISKFLKDASALESPRLRRSAREPKHRHQRSFAEQDLSAWRPFRSQISGRRDWLIRCLHAASSRRTTRFCPGCAQCKAGPGGEPEACASGVRQRGCSRSGGRGPEGTMPAPRSLPGPKRVLQGLERGGGTRATTAPMDFPAQSAP